jgi:transposase InsO family protein
MERSFEKEFESGTEGGRSPSGVPDSNSGNGPEAIGEPTRSTPDDIPVERAGPPATDASPPAFGPVEPDTSPRRRVPRPFSPGSVKRTYRKPEWEREERTPQERLLLLDTWRRSGLPAGDFSSLVGVSKHTLYAWKKRFDTHGPAGLLDRQKGGPRGSSLPELTRRTILMLKESNPDWGCQRISDLLLRGPALPASPGAVARVLREAGYVTSEEPTSPHPEKPREFERARSNQLWQTDIFTFLLKRQNRRVYLVAFLDDHSRYIVGYGLGASPTAAWVIEVFRSAVSSYHEPDEVLSDNGPQYVTWRGKSAFTREIEGRGRRHIVATPRHPETLGKIERFWGSLWRECVEKAVFLDLLDAQRRIGLYIDYYNLQRPHQGIGSLVPADRFFQAAPEVLRTLKERSAANALELARHGIPRKPFYLTGNAGGRLFSVHAEGERVILRRGEGEREEIELTAGAVPDGSPAREPSHDEVELPVPLCPTAPPGSPEEEHEAVPEPGVSPLDPVFGLDDDGRRRGAGVEGDVDGGREEGGSDDGAHSSLV